MTKRDLERLSAELFNRGLSRQTVKGYLAAINHFLKWAHGEGELENQIRAPLPNLRAFKEPWNAIDAAAATQKIAEAHRRLAPLRKRRWHTKDLDELTRKLTALFSDWRWPPKTLKNLAEGIIHRHSDIVRAMIQEGVGRLFGRGHTGIRDALAAEGRHAKEQRQREDTIARIVAGKRRYVEWLTRQGLKPHPAVVGQLKNPPTIS